MNRGMCGRRYALTTILCLHSESVLMVINKSRIHTPSNFLSVLVSCLVVNYKQLPEKEMSLWTLHHPVYVLTNTLLLSHLHYRSSLRLMCFKYKSRSRVYIL